MTSVDFKKKYEQMKRKFDKMKPYADTMARHNDRLENDNRALSNTVETFREKIKILCPHKQEWIVEHRQTQWGEDVMHYCEMCYSFIKTDKINRDI